MAEKPEPYALRRHTERELDRLRAVNAKLLEALEALTPPDWSLNDPLRREYANARAAIEAAKGDA